jgi:hypothetical protein
MNAVIARVDQLKAVAVYWRETVFLFLVCLGNSCAWAQSEAEAVVLAQGAMSSPDERKGPQVEVKAITLPRFDNTDNGTHSSRIDMTLLPPRRSALGLSLGLTSPSGSAAQQGAPFGGVSTSVDLGVHWRYTPDGNYRIDVTAWRRVTPPDAITLIHSRDATYGARVEMRIGPAPTRTGLVAERGFIGLQLDSGARIVVRRKHGGPMFYYRTKF